MLPYHSCHIFGTWREIGGKFFLIFGEIGWGGFLNHHMRGKPQRVGTIFYGESWTLQTPSKDFHLAIGGKLGWMKMIKKWGRERFYISCNYSFTISFLVKILLAKLKSLYIPYAWISIMKKQNSNQNVKIEKMVVFLKTSDYYHHKFNFGIFFQLSCKTVKEFETEI